MEVAQVLHMNGGDGEKSYAKNSSIQNTILSLTKGKKQEAAVEFFSNFFPESLSIADFGCSSGPNALLVMSDIIDAVKQSCRELGRPPPNFQLFLNDLFKNDFNNVFSLLPDFYNKLGLNKGTESGNCFVYGVPGSFYGRLLPNRSLHFVHSSTSLHWLSQAPKLEDEAKMPLNKGNVYISKTSPAGVKDAYLKQFQSDFSLFLKGRAEELVAGGRMVLTLLGRRHPDPAHIENCYLWELLTQVFQDMASENTILSLTKGKKQEAAVEFFSNFFPESLSIADFGCSSGPNALLVMSDIIDAVKQSCRELGRPPPNFQSFLNDLFKNDFNNVFSLLPDFYNKLGLNQGTEMSGNCFVYGAPGSFYGRLFPSRSLHFVHSSTSLQWLSQVPKLEDEEKVPLNKGNVYISKTSPAGVKEAYLMQFQSDFSLFLKCRAEELVAGGRMVLTLLGRRHQDPAHIESSYQWELLTQALLDMTSEGLVSREKIDTFNIPFYAASPEEVKEEIKKEGSFVIDTVESFEASWEATREHEGAVTENTTSAEMKTEAMRAVLESMLINHFGEEILEGLFERYHKLFEVYFSRNKAQLINVLISLAKKSNGGSFA